MSSKIKVLPHHVIDQIAAGEVVERPANLLKELIENSLDAGADSITVTYSDGGRFVQVEDNGSGIAREDIPLVLARHATSKISESADLWKLSSYGFRGEALASISSVSRLSLTTSQNGKDAYQLTSEFGQATDVVESRRQKGTTIKVTDLFENVPARLKFMKSATGEHTLIKTFMKALALSHPYAEFRTHQGAELIGYWQKADSTLERAKTIFPEEDLYATKFKQGEVNCELVISNPNSTQKQSRQIYIFVNGRYVQDKTIVAALMEAYRGLLMHGEYPTAVVQITLPPEDLDVNVHPTKSQVKFKNSSQIFKVVHKATRDLLETSPWLEKLLPQKKNEIDTAGGTPSFSNLNIHSNYVGESSVDYVAKTEKFSDSSIWRTQIKQKENPFRIDEVRQVLNSFPVSGVSRSEASWHSFHLIGQARLTYIVAEKDDAVVFIDQHAAHERVMYEKLLKDVQSGQIEVQRFLLPITVELTEEQMDAVMGEKENLLKYGLDVEPMGPTSLAINSAPAIIREESLVPAIIKLAKEKVDSGGSYAIEKMMREVLATMACHSAIRAGQALSKDEMAALLKQMDEFSFSSFCPHGRPVWVEYKISDMERDFGRTL